MTSDLALDVTRLEPHHVATLGRAVHDAVRDARSRDEVAASAVACLHESLRDAEGARAGALVRLYMTRRFGDLSPALRDFALGVSGGSSLEDDVPCLTLLASRGLLPAWNDVERSVGHRAIPLPSPTALERLPMIAGLVQQLGVTRDLLWARHGNERASEKAYDVFHVQEAAGSPLVPAQVDFVARHGIRSAFGFGGVLPDGELFAAILFVTHEITREVASWFSLVALRLRLAFLSVDASTSDSVPHLRSRAAALEQLLEAEEAILVGGGDRLVAEREQQRQLALEAERRRTQELSEQNVRLERTQRAMLNVIEDLRVARQELEERVEERTADLAEQARRVEAANAALRAKNADLEAFTYVASHDLQEPLRTIISYLQLIDSRSGNALDEEAKEFLGFTIDAARHQQALIQSLLEYSRVSTKSRPPRDVALTEVFELACDALRQALDEAGAELDVGELPVVRGDSVQLRQLVQNLLSNSLKFRGDAPARIRVRSELDGDWCRIRWSDAGEGFDAKFGESIFQLFRRLRRDAPGTGIGLAICKKIVERHGGTIRAHGQPGEGATFEFTLPRGSR